MHSTVGDMLRTIILTHPPRDVAKAYEIVDSTLASAQYAIRAAIHCTLQISPRALVFHRDMLTPIPIIANYNILRHHHQTLIDENNRRENFATGAVITNLVSRSSKLFTAQQLFKNVPLALL
jgi:hypothetical protein